MNLAIAQAQKCLGYINAISGLTMGQQRSQITCDRVTFDFDSSSVDEVALFARITKALQVRPDKYVDHNGTQATWDFDGHRVAVQVRWDGDSEFTLMPDPNVQGARK